MRTLTTLLTLLLLPYGTFAQSPGAASSLERLSLADSMGAWYALGFNAHHLCSGLWVVGRDHRRTPEAVIAEDMAPFPSFRWESDYRYRVDSAARTVTIADPQSGSRRSAQYNDEQGCSILPAGAAKAYFQPVRVRPSLRDPSTRDWPVGDRHATARFPGVDSAALAGTLDWAFDDTKHQRPQYTRGVIAVYRGKVVAERYAPGWGPYTPQLSWSMGKSIAATLIGVLVQQGMLTLDQPAPVAEWQRPGDPRAAIRIRDLLNMSSGLDFDNFGLTPQSYNAANEHFRIYFDALDVFAHSIHQPLRFQPGTLQRYRNSDPLTLMAVARRTLEAKGTDWLTFPQRQLFDRIGARSFVLETDAWGNFIITGFDYGGSRDWARLGLLYLWKGMWEGQRILPEDWATFVSTPAPGDRSRGYGGLFWLNAGGSRPRLPSDAYWMAGHMGQITMIIPSRDLVVVRHGPSSGGDARYNEELVARILEALPRP